MGAKSDLIAIFEKMGFSYWLMHTMPASEPYPETFFTFMTTDAPFGAYYDNKPHSIMWGFAIGIYSSDPDKLASVTLELVEHLQAAGWIVPDAGEDVPTDEPTHTGWRITAYYVQQINKEV